MARLDCPNGHAAVIRQDPNTRGYMAQCDVCGWTAPFVVARDEQDWRAEENAQLRGSQEQESQRRLTSPIAEKPEPESRASRRG